MVYNKENNKKNKERYFKKLHDNAEIIECACGCGTKIKNRDKYGRPKLYVNGHNGRKYTDPLQHKREWNKRNIKSKREYAYNVFKERKRKLINIKGGICEICGLKYNNKNASVFQFHHINPDEKEYMLSLGYMWRKWETLIKEVGKCKLLCANCHSQLHSSEY
ncbi:MAG: hypothetical protein PHN69_03130 [Candidatus Pacebacteria bacterium]|nr:hypothetical protein [Candidatus Paceibacterota bacterium]